MVNGHRADTLIDSGADGIFAGQDLARKLNLVTTQLKKPIEAIIANGEECHITLEAKNVPYDIQGMIGTVDLKILPCNHPTLIFGNTWLAEHNPKIN